MKERTGIGRKFESELAGWEFTPAMRTSVMDRIKAPEQAPRRSYAKPVAWSAAAAAAVLVIGINMARHDGPGTAQDMGQPEAMLMQTEASQEQADEMPGHQRSANKSIAGNSDAATASQGKDEEAAVTAAPATPSADAAVGSYNILVGGGSANVSGAAPTEPDAMTTMAASRPGVCRQRAAASLRCMALAGSRYTTTPSQARRRAALRRSLTAVARRWR